MSQVPIRLDQMDGGLNTTADENSLSFGWWTDLTNVMLDEGTLRRRGGMQRIAQTPSSNVIFNLNGTTECVTIPLNLVVHTLRRTWTIYALVQPDTVNAARTILGWAHATNWPVQIQFTAGARVEVKVTDSSGTVVTLTGTTALVGGTTYSVVVKRDGTALTVYLNGVVEATGTMADLDCKAPDGGLYLGRNNTGEFFDGKYDFCWATNSADPYMGDIFIRPLDPRAENVLWSYIMEPMEATTLRVDDDSRFENHGGISSISSQVNAISRLTMPVSMLAPYIDKNAKHRLVVGAGTSIRLYEIGE